MDNRTDQAEDLQSTPEHPAGRVPGAPSDAGSPGLTAGPHADPPKSEGADTPSRPWQERGAVSGGANDQSFGSRGASSNMKAFTNRFGENPLPWLISAAGLILMLLALQRARRH